jgi:uncharacterized protein (DUF885 family)
LLKPNVAKNTVGSKMIDRRNLLFSGSALLALWGAAQAKSAATAEEPAKLNALFEAFVSEQLDRQPEFATMLGLDTGNRAWQRSRLSDASPLAANTIKALIASQLARLTAIDRAKLTGLERTNFDAVLYALKQQDANDKRFAFVGGPYVLHQLGGSYQSVPDFLDSQHPIETKADADAYLARLDAFATQMDQECESVRHDVALGAIPPDFAIDGALNQMTHLRAVAPGSSPMADSVARRAKEKGIAGDYAATAAKILTGSVYPALDRQIALMQSLRTKAVHDAGVWRLPDGEAFYAAALEAQTTSTLSPDEVHKLGLEVVADCTAQADAIMKSQGFTKGTVGKRLRAMFDDPKFRYDNTDPGKEKLISDLNEKVARVQALLPKYFATLPKAGVMIKRVPKYIEAGAPGGYYNGPSLDGTRPGIYYINLRDTAEVPSWSLPTLTFHESIPGHHLQISIAQESSLPLIRKISQYNAYVEGWALYAEQLAVEAGLYKNDPWGHVGQLHDAMLRGVRLVVDTGMHAKRWSREKAIRYYADTLGDPDSAAITEIERYCVWPGQACGYMVGKIDILKLRDRAKKTLGRRFDIRKFHDAVLLSGALPLTVLETVVDDYIAGKKA